MRYCQEKGVVCQYTGTNMHCRLSACILPKESLYPTASDYEHKAVTALSTLQAENKKLLEEMEQVREDNKKLCAAMMTVRRRECLEPLRVVYELSYDAILSHEDIRNIARIVFDGLMREDLSLRGQKES